MRVLRFFVALAATVVVFACESATERPAQPIESGTTALPSWAYPINAPGAQRAEDDGVPRSVPGSTVELTLSQTRDLFNPPDWHPDSHPPLPEVVAHGRSPDLRACGYCHYPNAQGRPENASLAGLPAEYIVQQVADFRSGLRRSSEPEMGPPRAMVGVAEAATEDEVRIAAEYFAALSFQPWIRVVETDEVPETVVADGMHRAVEGGGTEPIGQRIIEMAEDAGLAALRDSRSGFVAYVPTGSVGRGSELVASGGAGTTIQCGLCHGPDLKGLGPVPPLAGRSPSYIVRQLYDMQSGARNGPWAALMSEVVARLSVEDMVGIAAYTASLEP